MSIATTFLLIIVLFATGKMFEAIKRFLVLLLDIVFKILNLFGFQINVREPLVRTSRVFNKTFKDIRIVKRSKHNNKITPSINIFALIIFVLSVFVVVTNLMYNGWISTWLYNNGFLNFIIKTQENMDTTFIAVMFSIISFSLSKLIHQWKDTSKYRKAKKEMRQKNRVLSKMSSKELLDVAKQKDVSKVEELKEEHQDDLQ